MHWDVDIIQVCAKMVHLRGIDHRGDTWQGRCDRVGAKGKEGEMLRGTCPTASPLYESRLCTKQVRCATEGAGEKKKVLFNWRRGARNKWKENSNN